LGTRRCSWPAGHRPGGTRAAARPLPWMAGSSGGARRLGSAGVAVIVRRLRWGLTMCWGRCCWVWPARRCWPRRWAAAVAPGLEFTTAACAAGGRGIIRPLSLQPRAGAARRPPLAQLLWDYFTHNGPGSRFSPRASIPRSGFPRCTSVGLDAVLALGLGVEKRSSLARLADGGGGALALSQPGRVFQSAVVGPLDPGARPRAGTA